MIRSIVSRLTYANVMATLGVFLALGGVSYAATQLPKNSVGSKQLKTGAVTKAKVDKKLLSSLVGKAGVAGAAGAAGAKGENGAPGAAGAKGETGAVGQHGATGATGAVGQHGATGATGAAGTAGVAGPKGDTGSPGADLTSHTPLPSGTTEAGTWATGSAPTGGLMFGAITFAQPLPTTLASTHVVYVSGATAAHCPGTGQADPGFLCVYQGVIAASTATGFILDPSGGFGAGRFGAYVFFTSTNSTSSSAVGTWAVTAP